MSTMIGNRELIEQLREAIARLSSAREMDGRVMVDLPIMYPSGSMVVAQVEKDRDKVLVSDMGYGLVEAELSAADDYFGAAAAKVAKEFSVEFDGYSIFTPWVPVDHLASAVACVGNASFRAADEAIRRASEVQSRSQNERIFDRVAKVFGREAVSRRAEIIGRHVAWEAHNVIALPNRKRAVFEYMTNHISSVSNKYMMFSDIRAVDEKMSLNTIVKSVDDLSEKAQMVSDLANIIPLKATDEQIRHFAET